MFQYSHADSVLIQWARWRTKDKVHSAMLAPKWLNNSGMRCSSTNCFSNWTNDFPRFRSNKISSRRERVELFSQIRATFRQKVRTSTENRISPTDWRERATAGNDSRFCSAENENVDGHSAISVDFRRSVQKNSTNGAVFLGSNETSTERPTSRPTFSPKTSKRSKLNRPTFLSPRNENFREHFYSFRSAGSFIELFRQRIFVVKNFSLTLFFLSVTKSRRISIRWVIEIKWIWLHLSRMLSLRNHGDSSIGQEEEFEFRQRIN